MIVDVHMPPITVDAPATRHPTDAVAVSRESWARTDQQQPNTTACGSRIDSTAAGDRVPLGSII